MVISSLFLNPKFILGTAIVIAGGTIILNRLIKNREKNIKDFIEETEPYSIFKREIKNLRESQEPDEKILLELGRISKDLFFQLDGIDKSKSYFEMANLLRKAGKEEKAQISENIGNGIYSGNKLTRESIIEDITKIEDIVEIEKDKLKNKISFNEKATLSLAKEI